MTSIKEVFGSIAEPIKMKFSKTKAMDHLEKFLLLTAREEKKLAMGKKTSNGFALEVTLLGAIITKIMDHSVKIKPSQRIDWLKNILDIAGIDPEVVNNDNKGIVFTYYDKGVDMEPFVKFADNYCKSQKEGLSILMVSSNNKRLGKLMETAKNILAESEEYEGAKRAAEGQKLISKSDSARAMFFNMG